MLSCPEWRHIWSRCRQQQCHSILGNKTLNVLRSATSPAVCPCCLLIFILLNFAGKHQNCSHLQGDDIRLRDVKRLPRGHTANSSETSHLATVTIYITACLDISASSWDPLGRGSNTGTQGGQVCHWGLTARVWAQAGLPLGKSCHGPRCSLGSHPPLSQSPCLLCRLLRRRSNWAAVSQQSPQGSSCQFPQSSQDHALQACWGPGSCWKQACLILQASFLWARLLTHRSPARLMPP